MPVCRLCGLDFVMITTSHLRGTHGIGRYEYLAMFPDAEMIDSWYRDSIGVTSTRSWVGLSEEEKKVRLEKGLHSKEAKERKLEIIRSPEFRERARRISLEDWAKYSYEERQELVRRKGFYPDRSQVGEGNYNWRGGHDCGYGYGWKDIEYFIFVRDKFTCQKCGTKDFRDNPITGHHIDYDKENMEDSNLITLCRRCNLEVNGDRWYWRDYFGKILEAKRVDVLLVSSNRP